MWLSDLKILLPDQTLESGSIRIHDGKIVEIIEGPKQGADVHAPHLTAAPGLVDMHGDMIEREVQPRPRAQMPVDVAIHELDKRLVGTGITTAFSAISFTWESNHSLRSEEKARSMIDGINELRPTLLSDMFVHSRFEITNSLAGEVLIELLNDQKVHLVSIMDHTPGQGQYRDIEKYIGFMVQWREKFTGSPSSEEEIREYIKIKQEIPKAWDVVKRVSEIAEEYDVILASHDDDTVEKIDMVADFGISISEFPVTAEAAQAARSKGISVAMGSPNAFRGQSTSGNLSAYEAVADGLVDMLATDYHPASMLQAAVKFANEGVMPLHESIKLVSANPARAVGLNDRGSIEVGKLADLVLFDGRERPRVHATFRQGIPVYWDRFMAELTHLSAYQVEQMN